MIHAFYSDRHRVTGAYGCLVQRLSEASKSGATDCAAEVIDGMPPVVWFTRRVARSQCNGLSMLQFRALYLIRARPMVNLSAVAEHIVSSLPTASRMVAVLQKKGLIKRCDCKGDRRQLELVITPMGKQTLDRTREETLTKVRQELSALDNAQLDLIARAMRLLRDVFEHAWLSDGCPGAKRSSAVRGETEKVMPST